MERLAPPRRLSLSAPLSRAEITSPGAPRATLAAGCDSEYALSMPNRQEMKPDRQSQEQARRKRHSVLIRDVYWSLLVAIIVLGSARLVASFFGG